MCEEEEEEKKKELRHSNLHDRASVRDHHLRTFLFSTKCCCCRRLIKYSFFSTIPIEGLNATIKICTQSASLVASSKLNDMDAACACLLVYP